MPDQVARNAAQQIKRGCDHSCEHSVEDVAEIIESALAPMREALQEGIDMVRVLQGGRIAGGWADRAERLLKGEQ